MFHVVNYGSRKKIGIAMYVLHEETKSVPCAAGPSR